MRPPLSRRDMLLAFATLFPARGMAQPDVPGASGFAPVRDALVAAMAESADALRDGRRHDATRALDRARRLARFATSAEGLDDAGGASFAASRHAMERGRHELQMGRPAEAAAVLAAGAEALRGAPLGESRPRHPDADAMRRAEGRSVIGPDGEQLGSLSGLDADGRQALLAVGGMLGIGLGAETRRVPADAVLLGGEYAMTLRRPG